MFSLRSFIKRISQYGVVGAGILGATMSAGSANAVEFPPAPFYFQTNSPNNAITNGDWYSASTAQNGGAGSNFITIHVPIEWPASEPVRIQLLSPDWNSGAPGSWDENSSANTYFDLFDVGADYDVIVPSVINGTSLYNQSYAPNSVAVGTWTNFYDIPAPVAPGAYLLAVKTLANGTNTDNSQNGYKVRVGRPSDMISDPDGIALSGDEIGIGTPGVTIQHGSTPQQITLYRPVTYMQDNVRFHNFDMENNNSAQTVNYYAPITGAHHAGTVSGNAVWNNGGTISTRVGDLVPPGPAGYWRVVYGVNNNNQFNLESLAAQPMLMSPPAMPILELTKDDGLAGASRVAGEEIEYSITFENIATPDTGGSKAYDVLLWDEIPAGTTYVSSSLDPITTVGATVSYNALLNRVEVTFDNPLDMLEAGAFTVTVRVDDNIAVTSIENVAMASYLDPLMFEHGTSANEETPINLPPTAIDHAHTVTRGDTLTVIPVDGLLNGSSDPNSGDIVTVNIVGTPTNGVVVSFDPNTGEFIYQADPLFIGTVTFTYTVTDGELVSEPATVTITIEDTEEPIVTGGGYGGPRELLVTFSQEMNCGVLDAVNYTVTGPGQGTLHHQPDAVELVPGTNTYRLIWNDGSTELAAGEPVTIIVNQANVCDTDLNPLDTPNTTTVLVPGAPAGPFPCVCPTP